MPGPFSLSPKSAALFSFSGDSNNLPLEDLPLHGSDVTENLCIRRNVHLHAAYMHPLRSVLDACKLRASRSSGHLYENVWVVLHNDVLVQWCRSTYL